MGSNAFWQDFGQSFFQQSQRAIENARADERDARERERFDWERQQAAAAQALRTRREALANDVQHGVLDTSGIDPTAVAAQAGMPVEEVQALQRSSRGAFDAANGPAIPGATRRKLGAAEVADRVSQMAFLEGNYAGGLQAQDAAKRSRLDDARRAEFARLSKLPDAELEKLFDGANADGNVPAMLVFEPKSRKYVLASRIPGVPTQSLSRAELVQGLIGAWEAGNGDYAAGIQSMVATAMNKRNLQNQDFDRSTKIASANADAYFKGLAADNDATRTAVARQAAAAQASALRMGSVQYWQDPKTGAVQAYVPTATREGVGYTPLQTPPGMVPYRPPQPINPVEVAAAAEKLVGMPTGRQVNGKPELHTFDTAFAAVQQAMSGRQAPGMNIDPSRIVLPGERPAGAGAAPAGPASRSAGPSPTGSVLDPATRALLQAGQQARQATPAPATGRFPTLGAPASLPAAPAAPGELDPELLRLLNGG